MSASRELVPLVSFPKSGNTWVRFILANLFVKEDVTVTFRNINSVMPSAYSEATKELGSRLIDNAPFFIKEHSSYENMTKKYPFKKAIYIVRDGFDAVYSYWHFVNARMPGFYPNMQAFMKLYHRDWGHWGKHVSSWLDKDEGVLVIKYENLLDNPFDEVSSILAFLGIEVDPVKVKQAIAASDRSEMKKMKGSDEFMSSRDKSFHFVRSATSGEGHKNLDVVSKSIFLSVPENVAIMNRFSYLESGDDIFSYPATGPEFFSNAKYLSYKFRYKLRMLLNKT